MMHNMVPPQEQLPIDEISSPLGGQIFEFCESELFPETLQNSEVASSSNCCYEEHSSYPTPLSITGDTNIYNGTVDNDIPPPATGPSSPTAAATRSFNLATMFMEDQIEDDISASIDFTLSPSFSVPHQDNQYYNNNNNHEPFAMPSLNNQIPSLGDAAEGSLYAPHQYTPEQRTMVAAPPVLPPSLPTAFKEAECLPPLPSYNIRLRNSSPACTLADPIIGSYLSSSSLTAPFGFDNPWIFTGGTSLFLGSDHLSNQELESQGDNGGFFLPDSLARVFNCSSGDLQKTLSSESQHLLSGSPSTTLASEISSLEDPTFKVGKLSAEERKRKIHRYLKKRNERNFSKKIKYACRKTLADSRPRVRGRFAKNDELGELARTGGTNHEDDIDDDVRLFSNPIPDHQNKVVKEEDGVDPLDIFANMSELNSFKCNYPIQSWI